MSITTLTQPAEPPAPVAVRDGRRVPDLGPAVGYISKDTGAGQEIFA